MEGATYLRDPGGLLLSVSSGGSMSNYGRDRLGSITALASASGSLTDTYGYDPWGGAIGGSGSSYDPFRYTGTYHDAATGLYQMGARYYQPASGRFTQLDPLPSKLLSVNRYAYTGCNPTNYTDPTGLHESDAEACVHALEAASILVEAGIVLILVALALAGASVTCWGVTVGIGAPISFASLVGAFLLAGIGGASIGTAAFLVGHACLGW